MKHLDVLSGAGLVTRNKTGPHRPACRLRAEPMQEANDWLNRYQRFWNDRLDQLARISGGRQMSAVATKPSLTIKRRFNAAPAKVFAAWIDPEKVKALDGPRPHEGRARRIRPARRRPATTGSCSRRMASSTTSAASTARSSRTRGLVFTWAWKSTPERESLVTVTFKSDGDGTLMTLQHEQFFDEDARKPSQPRLGKARSPRWKRFSPEDRTCKGVTHECARKLFSGTNW
ncbi:MAG: SRPBCC domain-containing protein [Pseudolabrys sp.]